MDDRLHNINSVKLSHFMSSSINSKSSNDSSRFSITMNTSSSLSFFELRSRTLPSSVVYSPVSGSHSSSTVAYLTRIAYSFVAYSDRLSDILSSNRSAQTSIVWRGVTMFLKVACSSVNYNASYTIIDILFCQYFLTTFLYYETYFHISNL